MKKINIWAINCNSTYSIIVLLEFRKTCSHIKNSTVTIGSINYGDSLIANHESLHTGEIDVKFTMLSSVHVCHHPEAVCSLYVCVSTIVKSFCSGRVTNTGSNFTQCICCCC